MIADCYYRTKKTRQTIMWHTFVLYWFCSGYFKVKKWRNNKLWHDES